MSTGTKPPRSAAQVPPYLLMPSRIGRRLLDQAAQRSGSWRLRELIRGNVVSLSARVTSPSRLSLGRGVVLQRGVVIHAGGKGWCDYAGYLRIGDGSVVGPYSVLYGAGGIDIGDYVHLGPGVKVMSQAGRHDIARLSGHPTIKLGAIGIGAGSWVGAGAVILGGVRVGCCATIGPNAVVQSDVPDYSVVAGNPARIVFRHEPLD